MEIANHLLAPDIVCWQGKVMRVKTSNSGTGYLNVLYQTDRKRKRPYYAKYHPPGATSQRMLPGSGSATAWEAAAKLAVHLETQAELPDVTFRWPRRSSEVRARCPHALKSFAFSRAVLRVPQEVRLEREAKQAKKQASLAARWAANEQNTPVQGVQPVPTGFQGRVFPAVHVSPMPMQPMPHPSMLLQVALAPGGF